MKLNHILHPTDFSQTALKGLEFAAYLARLHGATIHLFHTYGRPYATAPQSGGMTSMVDELRNQELREDIRNQIRDYIKHPYLEDLTLKARLVPDGRIESFYEGLRLDNESDIIVMGTEGHSNVFRGGLVDTNAEKVIRLAPIPTLTIPSDCPAPEHINTIIVPTDFKEPLDDLLERTLGLAENMNAKVYVVHINTKGNELTRETSLAEFNKIKAKFPEYNLELHIHNSKEVLDGIEEVVKELKADLIAMLTHGRTGFLNNLFRPSIAEDVSAYVKAPLLTVKNWNQ